MVGLNAMSYGTSKFAAVRHGVWRSTRSEGAKSGVASPGMRRGDMRQRNLGLRKDGLDGGLREDLTSTRVIATDVATVVGDEMPEDAAEQPSQLISANGDVSFSRLGRFLLPSCALWVISPVLSLVDTAVVGTRCSLELAALGPGVMMLDNLAYLCAFLGATVTNRVSVCFSRRDLKGAGKVLSEASIIALLLGALCCVALHLCAPAALELIAGTASASIVAPALAYIRIRAVALPACMISQAIQAYFLAAQDPFTPLLAMLLAASLNIVGDLWLVNGLGWGIKGAALATSFAQIATAGVLVAALYRPLVAGSAMPGARATMNWRFPGVARTWEFMKSCGGIFGTVIVKTMMYSSLTALATNLSPVHSGAHHVVMTLFLFFCFVGESMTMAAQAFVPGFIGQPKLAWKLARTLQGTALVLAVSTGLAAGSFLFAFPFLFTSSPAVMAALIELVPLFSLVLFFHCASNISEGLLIAGRDLSFLMKSYPVNIGFSLCTSLYLRSTGVGLGALWCCVLQFQITRLLFNWVRLSRPTGVLSRSVPLPRDG
ncbi:hypothetical protein BSKO_06194 [Bryopsis sp. KO-2023]|nr:hypothetical protein BSKO_06194 [Bryopsis sp. KO-2023]